MHLTRHLYILIGVFYESILKEKKHRIFRPPLRH